MFNCSKVEIEKLHILEKTEKRRRSNEKRSEVKNI